MEEAIGTLTGAGIPGAMLVLLGMAYYRLDQRLNAVQEARVADAQRVAAAALEREEKWQTVISQLADAVERVADRTTGARK